MTGERLAGAGRGADLAVAWFEAKNFEGQGKEGKESKRAGGLGESGKHGVLLTRVNRTRGFGGGVYSDLFTD
jgi:hypothetical protein